MKVGIVTFHAAANYGAVLQAFALQTFLRQAGHSPFFIDHQYGVMPQGIGKYIGRTLGDTLKRWANLRRKAVFADFTRRNLLLSERSYLNEQDLTANPPFADAYICGSDQVWNPNFLKHRKDEQAFFLDFGGPETRKIAYAASLGVSSLEPDWAERFAQHLKRFDYVSVREKNSIPILAPLGRSDAVWVPDPTLLLTADNYDKNLQFVAQEQQYVFTYTLDRQVPGLVTQIRNHVSKALSLPCLETYTRSSLRILLGAVPDPCQWLALLKSSRFVVTNSYHGLIFSLIFKRPFLVLPLVGASAGMNGRIESLLERVGLTKRFVTQYDAKQVNELCAAPIDWASVGREMRSFATIGTDFLAKALPAKIRHQQSQPGPQIGGINR